MFSANPIIISDSEDNCSQEANVAIYGNQNYADTKDDQSDAGTVIKNENVKEIPKAQPIAGTYYDCSRWRLEECICSLLTF